MRVAGKALIDHVLDKLAAAGVERAVVNVHHLADQIEQHLRRAAAAAGSSFRTSATNLLGTGGGVVKALPELGATPFFHVNSDTIWIDGVNAEPRAPRRAFDADRMDALLLLAPTATSVGYAGAATSPWRRTGGCTRRAERERGAVRLCRSGDSDAGAVRRTRRGARFHSRRLFDRATEAGRLHGLRLDGMWMHVGTPEAIEAAEAAIVAGAA